MDTTLAPDRMLDVLRADGDRLVALCRRDLALEVPTCPGWTIRDLVEHVAEVYQHKIKCTELLAYPDPWPMPVPPGNPVDWLAESLDELIAMFRDRGPDAPSKTWWEPDQTVGFWYRRMLQETAIHRADAEAAVGELTPIDEDVAADGIDEVLMIFFAGDWSDVGPDEWEGVSPEAGAGKTIEISGGGHAWRVTLHPDRIDVERHGDDSDSDSDIDSGSGSGSGKSAPGAAPADARISGAASDLVLWLWGRYTIGKIESGGDPAVLTALRDRLALATQ